LFQGNNGSCRSRQFLSSNNRIQLQATAAMLIDQLSSGEPRTEEQHQQIINAARYCLQQLRVQALESYSRSHDNSTGRSDNGEALTSLSGYNNHYNTFNSRYGRMPNTVELSCSTNSSTQQQNNNSNSINLSPFLTNEQTPLNSSTNSVDVEGIGNIFKNEPPPSYDTLIVKSTSLPSYCNLDKSVSKSEQTNK
jgi:hypothetical protein